jgi:hypothetical protein
MTKVDFLKKWAKNASGGKAVEGFERDVETLLRSTIRVSVSGVVNGLIAGLKGAPKKDSERLTAIVQQIQPAVETALRKLYE